MQLEFLEKHAAKPTASTSAPKPKPAPAASSSSSSAAASTEPEQPKRPYTPDQVEGIKRIKGCKAKGDLYAILGLEKGCSESDIKKAYRKVRLRLFFGGCVDILLGDILADTGGLFLLQLALQYHPDKCGAPGTDEAFKGIAFK
jgi:DnaJ family protein B protein 12